jgi:xylan 1,4-beta-xylosidase
VDVMSYWTFSDVFDEQGVVKQPFYGGFGLLAAGDLPKPAFNAFKLLHRLGSERLAVDSDHVLATRRPDGTLVIATWNLSLPEDAGAPRTVTLRIAGARTASATLYRVDAAHGDLKAAYEKMGSPQYPTQTQLRTLRQAGQSSAPEHVTLNGGSITITLPAKGLALLELR